MVSLVNDSARLLTSQEVADIINRTEGTLRNWRVNGRGPRWIADPANGQFLGYRREAVEDWIRSGEQATEEAAVG